ncbi:MAG: proline dehydrogenase family protein [Bacteroidia bacterium]|nr:proline dehydrogenase family protein [Bacteroidia bacterium]
MSEPGIKTAVSFHNTQIAFEHRSNKDLKKAYWLFSAFKYPVLVNYGPKLAGVALSLKLPFKNLIKNTLFAQFCGGETIEECEHTIKDLSSAGIGTILDYSVEGEEKEEVFEATCNEIIDTINKAKGNAGIPFTVFKVTGIGRFDLLEKVNKHKALNVNEEREYEKVKQRFELICRTAHDSDVRVFVDAEESWIQDTIDRLTMDMMKRYNTSKAIVYNTIQLYRHDRYEYLKKTIAENTFFMGFKLVRGAYMEKERARAQATGYRSPIQLTKEDTDRDYNKAMELCIQHLNKVSICAGTHNEESCTFLTELIDKNNIDRNDPRIYCSQLLGMSDHISYNLANAGYNVAKYVPYGPVIAVLPYLSRRAKENSSVKGQVGRELGLITEELKRRKLSKD